MDKMLCEWIADFSVNKEDICNDNKSHKLYESFNDGKTQILKCSKCGYESKGWFK